MHITLTIMDAEAIHDPHVTIAMEFEPASMSMSLIRAILTNVVESLEDA